MHTAVLHLTPILAAEKSKVPFYIAGGLLVVWALFISLVVGMRRADFPSNLAGQRAVSAITAVLVLGAASTAVLTAGTPAKSAPAAPAPAPGTGGATAPAPAAPSTSTSTATPAPGTPASSLPGTQTGARTSLSLAANASGALSYSTKQLSAKAGTVTIVMTNASQLEHNVTIASGSTVIGATPTFAGGNRSVTVALKPGTYTFYCSVPGHRQAGMEGTLTIS